MEAAMEASESSFSDDDTSPKAPDTKTKNVAEELDKRQTDGSETNDTIDGDTNASKQNGDPDGHGTNTEDKKEQDTRTENEYTALAENDINGEAGTEDGHQNDDKVDDIPEATDSLVTKESERTETNESHTKEIVEIHSEPDSKVMNGALEEQAREEEKPEPVSETTENEIISETNLAEVENTDDTEIKTDYQNQIDADDDAETYLVQHEAEKQVMHELIDETIVLEKDIGSLQTQLESTEKDTIELQTQVDNMKQENHTQKTTIQQLEVELREAKMGDGEQRRMLEESQQRVGDLEGQLKRMVTDDEEKSSKLSKAEKDILELTEKCRQLESESGENPQSKTCVIM